MSDLIKGIGSVDEYIKQFPEDVQAVLTEIRRVIRHHAPGALEKISYQMPTYWLNGNLVHFAAYRNHIGFYPTPSGIKAFSGELKDYKWAKGSVQFPLDKPIPYDLVARMVEFRVMENTAGEAEKR